MIQIAICDDSLPALEITYSLVRQYAAQNTDYSFEIHKFQYSYDLVKRLVMEDYYDIYLLDMIMPDYDGIDLGKEIRKLDEESIIIYLTTSKDYAVDSYQVHPFQYILKPVSPEALFSVMDEAISKFSKKYKECFLLKTKEGMCRILYSDITYIEYLNHILYVHLRDLQVIKSAYMRMPFEQITESLLKDNRFIRPHRAYIVNMDHIFAINYCELTMGDNNVIPVSRSIYKEVKDIYLSHLLKGE